VLAAKLHAIVIMTSLTETYCDIFIVHLPAGIPGRTVRTRGIFFCCG
jgi:hypothetical protein